MSIEFCGGENLPKEIRESCETLLSEIFSSAAIEETSVSVNFVSNDQMIELQKEFKNRDYATDVLSFPLPESETEFPHIENFLGDIAICVDVAKKQAQEFGHELIEEIAVLFAHGLFHLLGFDHEVSKEDASMQMQGEMYLLDCVGLRPELSMIARV